MRLKEYGKKLLSLIEYAIEQKPIQAVDFSALSQIADKALLDKKNTEEAWIDIDKYFDEAAIAGFRTVRLIHGKGTGALKNALWAYLKTDRRVARFRIGQYGEGDGGVTVVELK